MKNIYSLSTYAIIDNGASCCLDGESPSIITSGRLHSLSSTTILCSFGIGEICFGVFLLFDKFCPMFAVFVDAIIFL